MIKAESSSGLHTHDHEHNRVDPSKSPEPNSNTDHHNPYHAWGGRSGYFKHDHPHMEETDETDGPPTKYNFEEEWFRNPLTENNDVGSVGDDVDFVLN